MRRVGRSIARYSCRHGSSRNARKAQKQGRLSATQAMPLVIARTGCTPQKAMAALNAVWDGEFHHVGIHGRPIRFYSVDKAVLNILGTR